MTKIYIFKSVIYGEAIEDFCRPLAWRKPIFIEDLLFYERSSMKDLLPIGGLLIIESFHRVPVTDSLSKGHFWSSCFYKTYGVTDP